MTTAAAPATAAASGGPPSVAVAPRTAAATDPLPTPPTPSTFSYLSPTPNAPRPVPAPVESATGPAAFATFERQRQALIAARMETLLRPTTSAGDRAAKVRAITELGDLNAVEAIDTLITQVSFMDDADSALTGDAMKLHPAVGTLIKLGKPATAAALKAIHDLRPNPNPLNAPTYRIMLLTTVLRRVEGDDVAEFLLKRELDKARANAKPYFEQAIRELHAPTGQP
jgi:hypothetical protein